MIEIGNEEIGGPERLGDLRDLQPWEIETLRDWQLWEIGAPERFLALREWQSRDIGGP